MAVLERLPETAIIKGFKGSVDFYLWKGIACARMWPRKAVPTKTAAEVETWNFFRAMTQSWKDLDPLFKLTFTAMVSTSSQRNFDLYQSMQYGHQITYVNQPPLPPSEEASMIAIPIAYSPSTTPTTINVNSTSYTQPNNLLFSLPLNLGTFNRYRLLVHGASNQAGQTIAARVQELATGFALGDGNPDITIPNTASMYDSGDRIISSAPVTFATYGLALKGSNATVDISFLWSTLYLWLEE